ncbi:four helix bundle protein [Guyparkeria sp. SB14A]|uniref:four helix bundle protein n=1 Tax=Guyparkeria sp. SB14A TaxID=2571147 RepID=UPI002494E6B3|nr:four helix bundle protein [Guyparkeria sp. SB14A]
MEVWERAALLSAKVNCSLRSLWDPGFRDQIARAGASMLNNIAEGLSQESLMERNRFLTIASLSCSQLQACVHRGGDLGYFEKNQVADWFAETHEIVVMLGDLSDT